MQAVYTIGILDFFFDDADKGDVIHTVQLKNQKNQVFYDKLTFIYLTLPNFVKPLEALETTLDKWLFIFRHLPDLGEIPPALQEKTFLKLFQIAELIKLPPQERMAYEDSLKYYRDLKNVTDTAYDEGRQEGFQEAESKTLHRLMSKRFGPLPSEATAKIAAATREQLEQWLDRILEAKNIGDVFDSGE